jgi:predicted nucleotidyltransferase
MPPVKRAAAAASALLVLSAALAPGVRAAERRSSAPPIVVVPAPAAGLAQTPKATFAAPAAADQVSPLIRSQAAVAAEVKTAEGLLEALSPEQANSISNEHASRVAAELIEPLRSGEGGPADEGVVGPSASGTGQPIAPLARVSANQRSARPPVSAPAVGRLEPPASLRERLSDSAHFSRLWAQNLWFYVVQNIVMKWKPYHGEWLNLKAAGIRPPVSKPREFFAHMRVMGQTGDFYIMGFVAREDEAVIEEGIASFRKYFDSPEVGRRELKALEAFIERARHYNEGKRSTTYFRKIIRDNLLKASVMPPDRIAGFFDGLYVQQQAASAADFQGQRAADILERFREVMLEELAAEPQGVKGRVRAAILIGSFAYGAATPASDFDVELVTEGGSDARLAIFVKRMTERWKAEGWQSKNPVTFHMFPFTPSRRLVRMVHDAPYLVISPDERLAQTLATREGEPPAFAMPREMTRLSGFKRALQYGAVYLTSWLTK